MFVPKILHARNFYSNDSTRRVTVGPVDIATRAHGSSAIHVSGIGFDGTITTYDSTGHDQELEWCKSQMEICRQRIQEIERVRT